MLRLSARRTKSVGKSHGAGRQVKDSPSFLHSGSVGSSGWDVLAKTVAAAAARKAPESSTPQWERRGCTREPKEGLE